MELTSKVTLLNFSWRNCAAPDSSAPQPKLKSIESLVARASACGFSPAQPQNPQAEARATNQPMNHRSNCDMSASRFDSSTSRSGVFPDDKSRSEEHTSELQ